MPYIDENVMMGDGLVVTLNKIRLGMETFGRCYRIFSFPSNC